MLLKMLAVGIGGFVGANLRFLLNVMLPGSLFPWATFAANMVGCFGLALLIGVLESELRVSEPTRLLLTTGFFGALTTFSTFSYEVWRFLDQGDTITAGMYLSLSIVGGLTMSAVGHWLGQLSYLS
jgi:fluoride exporter